jgi:threonylcarbamoyladenosine tRNA methylthiotransferase MtaB
MGKKRNSQPDLKGGFNMPKAALHNLGCKVNAYEAEAMQQQLEEHGYEIVPFDQKADVYIINTCSVTNVADKKSRQMLHRAKRMNPDSVVVAAGCYVQVAADILEKDGCVDVIIGNNQRRSWPGSWTDTWKGGRIPKPMSWISTIPMSMSPCG